VAECAILPMNVNLVEDLKKSKLVIGGLYCFEF